MANKSISQLSAVDTVSEDDLLLLSKEVDGSYVSRAVSIATLSSAILSGLEELIDQI